jgi:polyketide cyclase/dehydrase/lipid transport protein
MLFEESVKFDGDANDVWMRASDVQEIPDYWHGTRSLEVIGRSGNAAGVKVKFAFGGSGEAVVFTDEARRTVTIDYRSGPFTGRQVITVSGASITAKWDVRFRGVYRLAARWNEGHFRSGTVHALQRLSGAS